MNIKNYISKLLFFLVFISLGTIWGQALTSATYDASTGVLVVTGTGFTANGGDDINASTFTITGEGGATYTLVGTPNVEISSATEFTLNLDATDKDQVNRILNINGTQSTNATGYNLAGAINWLTNGSVADAANVITVSAVSDPVISSATYDYTTNTLGVTGTGFVVAAGATNDVDVSALTLTGEGGATYTLATSTDVEITSTTQFSIILSGNDIQNVETILNANGASSLPSSTLYNVAAADNWMIGATAGNDISDATSGITVVNYTAPSTTSATYDYNTNTIVVTGDNFVFKSGGANDVDVSKLAFNGEGGASYTLTSATDVEITSASTFTVVLSGMDIARVEYLLNKNGATAASGGQTFNLVASEDWMTGSPISANIADGAATIIVSNYAAPTITSATYDYSTNALVVTGTNLVANGSGTDVDVSTLTFTGEAGGTYTLASTGDVGITSPTQFSVTLAGDDKNVEEILNNDGTTSTPTGTTYNLAAADGWMLGSPGALDIADATGNGITVSNFAVPVIASATYNASTGVLSINGTNFVTKNGASDVDASLFTITAEGGGGSAYTLTDTPDIEISSSTAFNLVLSATDKDAVNKIINKNGTTSTSGTTYNLAGAEDWMTGSPTASNVVDATNGVTASNVAIPTITSATYDYSTNTFVVTGTNFLIKSGAGNDIDLSDFTINGKNNVTYTLTTANEVDITSSTSFTFTISGADLINIEALLNQNGTSSAEGSAYNLAAADGWAEGADAAVNTADLTSNGITVSNYAIPTITSATYNWSNGQLAITGTNFVANPGATNDIDASLITITGEGGATYTLTDTPDVEVASTTSAILVLSATDKLNVHGLFNKNGLTSGNATTYNLAGNENWLAGSPGSSTIADLTGNAVTVSNVAVPTITSATYDSASGNLVVTGTNFFRKSGGNNDVDISLLTFTGEGGTYTLTSTTDVEITSATQFTVIISGADKTGVDAKLDQNGTASSGATTYNLAAAEDWLTAAETAANIADLAGNGITVFSKPQITSASYNATTGVLTVTGTNIQANGGGADIDASMFTITGEGGNTRTLTNTADVEITSSTAFTLTLSANDKTALNQFINKEGTTSRSGTTYNIAAADDWCTVSTSGNSEDLTGNSVNVVSIPAPTITSATYDLTTGKLVVAGTGFLTLSGIANDIITNYLSIRAEGSATYVLSNTLNIDIISATSFSITLHSTDKENLNKIINKNGTTSTSGTTYELLAAEDWAAGSEPSLTVADVTGNTITASNVPIPAITSAVYNHSNGTLVVTGTGFSGKTGTANDVDASLFTFTGQGGATFTLSDTPDVEITSTTTFTLTLSSSNRTTVNALLNKNGSKSSDNTTYNLAAAEDWILSADAAVNVVDATNAITVNTLDSAPTSDNTSITVDENKTYTFSAGNFPFYDVGGDSFNGIQITQVESKGDLEYNGGDVTNSLVVNDVTKLTFKPVTDEAGTPYAHFLFKVIDNNNTKSTSSYTMTINVTDLKDAPIVINSSGATINEDATFSITSTNLQATDTDSDDAQLTFIITGNTGGGNITKDGTNVTTFIQQDITDGKIKYEHNGAENATETIKFVVRDESSNQSAESTIVFTITGKNDAPEFTSIPTLTYNEDEKKTYSEATIKSWITDADNDNAGLTVTMVSQSEKIVITKTSDIYELSSPENWFGSGTVKLTVTDGEFTADSVVTVTVASVNDLPVITGLPTSVEFDFGGNAEIDLSDSFSDIETEKSALDVSFSATPDSLAFVYVKATGLLTITAVGSYSGTAIATVTIKDADGGEATETISVTAGEDFTGVHRLEGIPNVYTLSQNYPNPFNPSTKFRYGLPSESNIRIIIFDVVGSEVISEKMTLAAGNYEYKFDAHNLASGIYFYVLVAESETGIFKEVKKMLLVK